MLCEEVYKMIDDKILRPTWLKIKMELFAKKFVSLEDISTIMDEARALANELFGPEVLAESDWRLVIPIDDAMLITEPELGLKHCIKGSWGHATIGVHFPSGDLERHELYKGLV